MKEGQKNTIKSKAKWTAKWKAASLHESTSLENAIFGTAACLPRNVLDYMDYSV